MPSSDDKVVYDRPSPAPAPSSYPQGPRPSVSGVLDPLVWKKKPTFWRRPPSPLERGRPHCRSGLMPRRSTTRDRPAPAAHTHAQATVHTFRTRGHTPGRPQQGGTQLYTATEDRRPRGPRFQKKQLLKAVFRRSHGERGAGRDGLNYHAVGALVDPGVPSGDGLGHPLDSCMGPNGTGNNWH